VEGFIQNIFSPTIILRGAAVYELCSDLLQIQQKETKLLNDWAKIMTM